VKHYTNTSNPIDFPKKAKSALEEINKLIKLSEDYPEPECSKCGRIIYCGVNTLRKEKECGLRNE